MQALVTGGAGFIGANLASRLVRDGFEVTILDSLARPGVSENLYRLQRLHAEAIKVEIGDVRDNEAVTRCMTGVDVVFHLAAQVAVTTSLANPINDFDVNLRGTLNVLEAARRCAEPPVVIYSSTNKVYGDLADVTLQRAPTGYGPTDAAIAARGIDERRPLDFHTPYGCSKGGADQYVLDYARSFGLRAMVLRMSCIYGPWQMGTEDQGWVAHFILRALAHRPITIYGDGHQVRDILFIDDAVNAYVRAWEDAERFSGTALNLGGGPKNAVSLVTLIAFIERTVGYTIPLHFESWRPGDQRYFVTDTRKARDVLKLPDPVDWKVGVPRLIEWLSKESKTRNPLEGAEAAQ